MNASNMVLGMLFAKARDVRRKDIFLDGVLAGSVKNPAAAFVLVAALSPRQGKRPHGPTITGIVPSSGGSDVESGTSLTISGTNFGAAGSTVSVSFSYISADGSTRGTRLAQGTVGAGGTGTSPTISVETPDMDGIVDESEETVNVTVIVTVGGRTSNPSTITYTTTSS
jgi:hypothetical protein